MANLPNNEALFCQNNKFIVLTKETTAIFPLLDIVSGLDWQQLANRPPVVVSAAPSAAGATPVDQRMANSLDLIASTAQDDHQYRTERKQIINVNLLPEAVKRNYTNRQERQLVIKSTLQYQKKGGTWVHRKYINDWTIDIGGVQHELFFIKFPDKPDANTQRWNFLI